MTRSQHHLVVDQFGARAAAYVESAVHAGGEDLDALAVIAETVRPSHAIDLGAGGGHVAYRIAPFAGAVVAADLSEQMMEVVAREAQTRGLANVATCVAPAEALPFADGTFDFLACRFSAHHWRDFEAGLREARRVVPAGTRAIFFDVVSPGGAALDTHLQAVELLRDPSHIRDYSVAEWLTALGRAGFAVGAVTTRRLRMDYPTWVERMRTDEAHRAAIRSLQAQASDDVVRHFEIEADGCFTIDTAQIEAVAV